MQTSGTEKRAIDSDHEANKVRQQGHSSSKSHHIKSVDITIACCPEYSYVAIAAEGWPDYCFHYNGSGDTSTIFCSYE